MSSEARPRGPAPSNVDLALEAIRDAIVDGRLRPGERIKEVPLAEALGFSRAPVRDALRLLERDGLVELVPNRGAVVPALHAVDVLEVYALRAALGTLALHKLMLAGESLDAGPLERQLTRLVRAGDRRRARDAADADLAYQQAIVTAAGLPRVSHAFERLTWQVRMFLGALEIELLDDLERVVAEVQALHAAILARDVQAAERLWREKFERWISGLVGRLDEPFDHALWLALSAAPDTTRRSTPRPAARSPRSSPRSPRA
jgi:DNA-binding GntR family transcriptional regulator